MTTICLFCQKSFDVFTGEINRGYGKYCCREHFYMSMKGRPSPLKGRHAKPNKGSFKKGQNADSRNVRWKGDEVGYQALHDWIRRKLGKPSLCEFCGKNSGIFDWANKSHEYKRDLTDWIRLCRSCHYKFDKGLLLSNVE